ncbi:MAG: helix-turn-helix domain-containing protein [Pseudonocardiaceae bacterium]|nr:helix-turn-helix domain-containing protein [Pseudonocardiaceae bacterium]
MRQLGRTLRRLREQVGYTQEEAGRRLRFSDKKISRLEQGQLPGYHELRAMLDVYGLPVGDWDPIVALFERAEERGWWHAYGIDDRGFVALEAEASVVRSYQLGQMPGLLQTEAYIRAGASGTREPPKARALENQVAVRLRRQRRLIEEPLLQFHTIMDESVLWRPVLTGAEQRAQLQHIVERARLHTVKVQVIPLSIGGHDGRDGNFSVLSFPDPHEPDIAYVEQAFASFHIEEEPKVRAARLAFEYLADLALDEQDSIALIERLSTEL